jgi:hypothetical protein
MLALKVLTYAGTAVYIIIWLWLLIDCLRRKDFYPIFGHGPGTKVFWLVTFIFFNPILTLLYLIFGRWARPTARSSVLRSALIVVPVLLVILFFHLPGRTGSRPREMARESPGGEMETKDRRGLFVEAQAATIQARDSMNSYSTVSSSNEARFACRRIVIRSQSDHRLLERVGVELQKRLSELPFVEEIDYYPSGSEPEPGNRAPDVTILLDLPKLKDRKLPLNRWLVGTVSVEAAISPYGSSSFVHDSTTPPIINFSWGATLQHKSLTQGFVTKGAKYKLAAADIAKQIAGTLTKTFEGWREKHGTLPELPASFYGPYRPAPDLAFLPEEECETVQSAFGLFRHNHTIWRFLDDRDTTGVFNTVQEEMESRGWKTYTREVGPHVEGLLRLSSGTQRLEVFPQRRRRTVGMTIRIEKEKPAPEETPYIVHYREVFTDAEIDSALADLIESDASADTLLMFEDAFHRSNELRERFDELVEKRPARLAASQLALSEHFERRDEPQKARQALLSTRALLLVSPGQHNLNSNIKRVARKLDDADLATMPIPVEIYRDLGFAELDSPSASVEREVALEEPLLAFHEPPDGKVQAMSVRVGRPTKAEHEGPYVAHYVMGEGGSRSWGTASGALDAQGHWRVEHSMALSEMRAFFEVESLDNGKFRVQIRREF